MKHLQARKLNSRFQRHSISLFSLKFFSTIASFAVIYYYSHHLTEAEYGSYQTIWTRSFFLSAFAGLGLSSLVFTYTPSALKKIVISISWSKQGPVLLIPLISSFVFAALQATDLNTFLIYLLFFSLYAGCNTLEVTLGALHLFRFLPFISLMYAFGFCLIHYVVYSNGFDVDFLFALLLPLLLIRLILYALLIKKGLKKIVVSATDELDKGKLRSLWKHLYFFEASQIVILYADKFFLSQFLPDSQFAVYFNATISIPFIGLLFSAVNNAAFMEYAQQQEDEKRIAVLHHTGKLLSSAAFPCFFFLLFFSEELFSIFFSEKYLESVPIFIVTLLALPVRLVYAHTLVLQSNHRGSIINKGVFIDVIVSLLLFVPLYFAMGLKGVALAFILGTFAQAFYYLVQSGRTMGVPFIRLIPLKNWSLKFLFYGAGIFLVQKALTCFSDAVLKNTRNADLAVLVVGGIFIGAVSAILFWKEFRVKSI